MQSQGRGGVNPRSYFTNRMVDELLQFVGNVQHIEGLLETVAAQLRAIQTVNPASRNMLADQLESHFGLLEKAKGKNVFDYTFLEAAALSELLYIGMMFGHQTELGGLLPSYKTTKAFREFFQRTRYFDLPV